MTAIFDWIKNIVFCLIIITVVLNVVPDNQYKKYVKVFTGILLVILIISPLDLFGNFTEGVGNLFDSIRINADVKEFEQEIYKNQEEYFGKPVESYKNEITNQINEEIKKDQYVVKSLEFVTAENGELGLNIEIAKEDESKNMIEIEKIIIGEEAEYTRDKEALIIKIKNFVKDFYNLRSSNINISIQR